MSRLIHALVLVILASTVGQAQPTATSPGLSIEPFSSIGAGDYALTCVAVPPESSSFAGFVFVGSSSLEPSENDMIWRIDPATGDAEVYAELRPDSDPTTIEFAPEGGPFATDVMYVSANNRDGFVGGGDCGGALTALSYSADPATVPPVEIELTGATSTPCGPGTLMQLQEPSAFVFDPDRGVDGQIHVLNSSSPQGDIMTVELGLSGAMITPLLSDGLSGSSCTAANGIAPVGLGCVFSLSGAYGSRVLYFNELCGEAVDFGLYMVEVPLTGTAASPQLVTPLSDQARSVRLGPDTETGDDTLFAMDGATILAIDPSGFAEVWAEGFGRAIDASFTAGTAYVVDREESILYRVRPAVTEFSRADCNADGGIDISDPIGVLDELFSGGAPSSCEKACDANDDGAKDIGDVIFTLSFLFDGGAMPPAPFGACGTDPTVDSLTCDSFAECP